MRGSTYAAVGCFFPGRRFSFDWDLRNRVAASESDNIREERLELALIFLEGWSAPQEQRRRLQLLDVS